MIENVITLQKNDVIGKNISGQTIRMIGRESKIKEVEAFKNRLLEEADAQGIEVTDNLEEADAALLFLYPESGDYFNATDGYLELGLVENKEKESIKDGSKYEETTLSNLDELEKIVKVMQEADKPVITSVNFTLAWILDTIEPDSDALIASFDTFESAQMDVIFGKYNPTGRLSITLPKNQEVLAVDEDGIAVSPNDVPGYAKSDYMEDDTYPYEDSQGNIYQLNFGLSYY